MSKVYIAMGECGEWSDRRDWPVIASLDESVAAEKVAALDVWLREHKVHPDSEIAGYGDRPEKSELDPYFDSDYTGTRYYIMAVDLV